MLKASKGGALADSEQVMHANPSTKIVPLATAILQIESRQNDKYDELVQHQVGREGGDHKQPGRALYLHCLESKLN